MDFCLRVGLAIVVRAMKDLRVDPDDLETREWLLTTGYEIAECGMPGLRVEVWERFVEGGCQGDWGPARPGHYRVKTGGKLTGDSGGCTM